MLFDIIMLILGLTFLIFGGDSLVNGAKRIGLRLGVSSLVIGLTVVAFGTSAPELLISIQSALKGSPDIAMGNVVGSNICNLGLVLGCAALVAPMPVHRDNIRINWPVTCGASILLIVLGNDGLIDLWEGLLFIVLLATYLFFTLRYSSQPLEDLEIDDSEIKEVSEQENFGIMKGLSKDMTYILLGGLGLYFGSEWFVESARAIATHLGVSERVIGITLVALGTSLPELVTSLIAAVRRDTDLALGGLLGSNIFNIFSILGITSLIHEIHVDPEIIRSDFYWMLGITVLVFPMMFYRYRIFRGRGTVLLLFYTVYTYLVVM